MKRLALIVLTLALVQQPAAAQQRGVDAEIDALTARVEKLEGTRAVKKLQRAFGYYVDRGLWADAADLFADDGTVEIGIDGVYAGNPAELAGIGPIPAPLARLLAADSTWRRLVTDPVHGHLLDYGTTTYTPPRALRNYVITRDRTCRFPGCTQPADHADLDHTTAWTGTPVGGTTSATNLHTLCRRHHRLKTHHNWTVTTSNNPTTSNRHPDTLTWTSPRGKHYLTHPPPQLEPPAPNRQTPLEIRLRCRLTAT